MSGNRDRIIMYAGLESIFMFTQAYDGTGYSRLEMKNVNKDIDVFLKNAQYISDLIVEQYADFIKDFTKVQICISEFKSIGW